MLVLKTAVNKYNDMKKKLQQFSKQERDSGFGV